MLEIKVFDPASISQKLTRKSAEDLDGFNIGERSPERGREDYLQKLASDARCGLRDVLIANRSTVTQLKNLESFCPNFAEAVGVYVRAALVSLETRTEMRVPPILLVGPPGVGKTYFARKLASALGTDLVEHSLVGADDTLLTGHSLSWRGARAGIVARTLIEGPTASPIIFLDELDKAQSVAHADILDPLHALLEPENAKHFSDTYLEVPIRADKILWIATANEVSQLKTSIVDRFLVLYVEPPGADERSSIIRSIHRLAASIYDESFDRELTSNVIDALVDITPRRVKLVLNLATGFAIADGRKRIAVEDILAAQRLSAGSTKSRIGF